MITGDYEYLKQLAGTHVCAYHGAALTVAWHDKENCYVLRCGEGEYPEEVTRQLSLTQALKAGAAIPEPIAGNILKGQRRRAMTQGKDTRELILGEIPKSDLGTGEVLTVDKVQALLRYTSKYALDAYRGHVVVMYGKPYITIDGYLYHANKSKEDYQLKSRPLTNEEKGTYQVEEQDHAWVAEIIMAKGNKSFTGIGIVTRDEMTAVSTRDNTKLRSPVVAAHPWQLAQKRAEWQALRRAFPIGETEEV